MVSNLDHPLRSPGVSSLRRFSELRRTGYPLIFIVLFFNAIINKNRVVESISIDKREIFLCNLF